MANYKKEVLQLALVLPVVMSTMAAQAVAADLPTNGKIVAGSGSISQSGTVMNIQQNTAKMAADWQSFSIGAGHTVNFIQPSSSSVALNRVLGSDVSVIQGALNANGHVFLVNPNGVTFTTDAQVNVGGLLASTLNIKTDDFLAGRYTFGGDSSNAVINQGNIHAMDGGTVALIAANIVNTGTITANRGNILMAAGKTVTLDLGGPVKIEIEEGALNTLIEQGGALRASGGQIYLTAKAAGDLATSVINHTGISEAQTLATGEQGQIVLLGDMHVGVTKVAGELNAAAPSGGDGGFIETSAATVDIAANTKITASSAQGKGGTWLIDPYNYTIDASAASNIANTLNTGTNVTITTANSNAAQGGAGLGNGDITVASAITKTAGADATLSLFAANTIALNAEIKSTSGKLNLLLDADNDGGTRDGGGVIIANKGVSLNGGNLNFGTGATHAIGGVSTLVGGDVYVGGNDQVVFSSGGGNINLYGQLLIANQQGVKFITSNGNAHFYDIINSGNKYEKVDAPSYWTWDAAFADAKNGTAGGSAVGDSYLATVTSRLENSVVVYTGAFPLGTGNNITDLSNGAWLGGKRTAGVWRWVAGPEAAEDGGQGLAFRNNNNLVSGVFSNWKSGEPNGGTSLGSGEDRLQIGNQKGEWNDLVSNDGNVHVKTYIRETNFDTAKLEIDAGTGTVTFDKSIGGLKGINYTAYDVSNPKPVTSPSTSPSPSTAQQNAVAFTQTTSNTPMSADSVRSDSYTGFAGSGAQVNQNSGTSEHVQTGVGTMEIIHLRSDKKTALDNKADDASVVALNTQKELSGSTKLFVIDGGVNMPASTNNEESR